MSKMKNESYYVVEGWMINELGLKGNSLCVYAIIYGFTKDGEGEFTGAWSYLASCLGCVSAPTVNNALKDLVAKEYIIKKDELVNGQKYPKYRVNPTVKKVNGEGKVF